MLEVNRQTHAATAWPVAEPGFENPVSAAELSASVQTG